MKKSRKSRRKQKVKNRIPSIGGITIPGLKSLISSEDKPKKKVGKITRRTDAEILAEIRRPKRDRSDQEKAHKREIKKKGSVRKKRRGY